MHYRDETETRPRAVKKSYLNPKDKERETACTREIERERKRDCVRVRLSLCVLERGSVCVCVW